MFYKDNHLNQCQTDAVGKKVPDAHSSTRHKRLVEFIACTVHNADDDCKNVDMTS